MKMNRLLAIQRFLLVNWIIAPALAMWIWMTCGFFKALLFFIIWLIIDKAWDWLSGLLIAGAGKIGASEEEALQMELSVDVPVRMVLMMILDLMGTLLLPWIVAGIVWAGSQTQTEPLPHSVKQWWIDEYPELVQAVANTDNRTLSTTYRTGPSGTAEVKLTLVRKLNGGLILKMNLPAQAILSVDPKTGEKQPSLEPPVITFRDQNEDGVPDDFDMEPRWEPLYKETVAEDGFIKFRSGPDHQSIWMQWSIAIGYSINHFLHNFDSALPRE